MYDSMREARAKTPQIRTAEQEFEDIRPWLPFLNSLRDGYGSPEAVYDNCSSSPPQPMTLANSLSELEASQYMLREILETLVSRLDPVLRPCYPAETSVNNAGIESKSPAQECTDLLVHRNHEMCSLLNGCLSRLSL